MNQLALVSLLYMAPLTKVDGFSVKYMPFAVCYYRGVSVQTIRTSGYDVTSLLTRRKKILHSILKRSRSGGTLEEHFIRFYIQMGAEKWVIDASGNATLNGKPRVFLRNDFYELKKLFFMSLPSNDLEDAGLTKR